VAFGPVAGLRLRHDRHHRFGVDLLLYRPLFGGHALVQRYGGDTVNRLSRFIGKNDFLASLIVRSVPTAPGRRRQHGLRSRSQANFWRYTAGVIVGSIPKILIVALLGQSVLSPWAAA